MKRLIEILEGIRPDIDFDNELSLMDSGILDSFDIVSIISELNDEYDIAIRVNDLRPENFNSAESIMRMIEQLKNK